MSEEKEVLEGKKQMLRDPWLYVAVSLLTLFVLTIAFQLELAITTIKDTTPPFTETAKIIK